jgi:RNA polymerase sigma factor (sigma-70 family)
MRQTGQPGPVCRAISVSEMTNPIGYLYRVGQTAGHRDQPRPIPVTERHSQDATLPETDLDLIAALRGLSPQQRVAVMLVHAFGYTLRETADVLDISVATVREHIARGLQRLRSTLEVNDEH